ncbi:metallophosphoesterase family protein [Haloferax volcanii]|uniref:metallophosphoesterase family protein n=1 Tax=Haloferax volcanii TaxID=2246 RepID=UPI00349F5CB2
MDDFIDYCNSAEIDFAIANGDLVDGPLAEQTGSTDGERVSIHLSWLQTVTDYLENSGGSNGNGLNCPVYYNLGNHEYETIEWGGDSAMGDVYSTLNMGDYSGSYYSLQTQGLRFLFINSSYRTTADVSYNHIDSQQQTWLENELADAKKKSDPVIVITHYPLSGAAPHPINYDDVGNKDAVVRDLNDSAQFVGGFFGHSHHTYTWDHVLETRDRFGNQWIHNPQPNVLEGDDTKTNFTVISASGSTGTAQVSSGYDTDRFPTKWVLGRGGQTKPTQQAVTDSGISWSYNGFETLDGVNEFSSGGHSHTMRLIGRSS